MNFAEYRDFQHTFLGLLEKTTSVAGELQLTSLLRACEALKARVGEERFYLSILGEIKRGKSTLINALLGSDLLPKSSLVCTAALCVMTYAQMPEVTVFYHSGKKETIDPKSLSAVVTRKNPEFATIRHVEIGFPLDILKEGIVIVDTPGVNDTDEVRQRITEEFIPRSDGVIFVLNAGQPLSNSEMLFLTNGVLKHHLKKVWFVINGMDRLATQSDREEALSFCRKHLEEILPGARLFPVSAKLGLQGALEGDSEKKAAAGVAAFFETMADDLVEGRFKSLFTVPIAQLRNIGEDLERGIAWSIDMLEGDREKLRQQALEKENLVRKAEGQVDRLLTRFHSTVEALVYESANNFRREESEDLIGSIRRILASDAADEKKMSDLSALANAQMQCFRQRFLDHLHAKVDTVARQIGDEILQIASQLDSRPERPEREEKPEGIALALNLEKPDVGLSGRGFISGFGRLSTMVFLLQGNVLFAVLSLAAFLVTRFRESDAVSVNTHLREQLLMAKDKSLDECISRRQELAAGYSQSVSVLARQTLSTFAEIVARLARHQVDGEQAVQEQKRMLFSARDRLVEIQAQISQIEVDISQEGIGKYD